VLALYDDKHFFQTVLEPDGHHIDLFGGLARPHYGRPTDRHSLGENTIVAGRVEHFSHVHLFFVLNVIDDAFALSQAPDGPVDTVLLRDHTSAIKRRIRNQQRLRGGRKRIQHLAYDPVRRYHCHSPFNPRG